MKFSFHTSRLLSLFIICLSVTLVLGCELQSTDKPSGRPLVDRSPEAKFDRIVTELRTSLKKVRKTILDSQGSGTAVSVYDIEILKEVSKPTEPGEPMTTQISITQITSYSDLPSRSSSEDEDTEEAEDPSREVNREMVEDAGIEVLDDGRFADNLRESMKPSIKPPESLTGSIDDVRNQVIYELIFEQDRWKMAKPPSVDAPKATNQAMEIALSRQG